MKYDEQPKWAPRITTGVLGIFMGFTPLVGNAILRKVTFTSAYATDDTAALGQLGLIGASIFIATGIKAGPALWAKYVYSGPLDGIHKALGVFLISPLLYVGSSIIMSVISWGILRSSGYAINFALSKALITGAVGSLAVGGSLWAVMMMGVLNLGTLS